MLAEEAQMQPTRRRGEGQDDGVVSSRGRGEGGREGQNWVNLHRSRPTGLLEGAAAVRPLHCVSL